MNALSIATNDVIPTMRNVPIARIVRAYLIEAKYESLRTLRSPGFALPFLALPVLLYLLFAVALFGDAIRADPKAGIFMFAGFSVFGTMGPGMFGFGIILAMEREQGLLTFKRALPMPPAAYLFAKLVMSVVFVALVMLTMLIAAQIGRVPLTIGQMLAISAIDICGAVPFCALGLLIGTLTSAKAAPAVVNLIYLPMIYLSGIVIPLPKSMQMIALASPAYHLDQLAFAVAWGAQGSEVVTHVAFLLGVTVLFTGLALRRLKRAA
jgi:ABC-2 type transport system permease protein